MPNMDVLAPYDDVVGLASGVRNLHELLAPVPTEPPFSGAPVGAAPRVESKAAALFAAENQARGGLLAAGE